MIKTIDFSNYKAFKKGKLEIKPITLLLGANSVGKSALIQLILMLQQTSKVSYSTYNSPLKLYGGHINLGDPPNIYRRKDISQDLNLSIEIEDESIKTFFEESLMNQFTASFQELPHLMPLKGFQPIRDVKIENLGSFEAYLDAIIEVLDKPTTQAHYKDRIKYFLRSRSRFQFPAVNKDTKAEILNVMEYLTELSKFISSNTFKVNYTIGCDKIKRKDTEDEEYMHQMFIKQFEIRHSGKSIINFNPTSSNILTSSFFNIEDSELLREVLLVHFNPNSSIFECFRSRTNWRRIEDDSSNLEADISIRIFEKFQESLKRNFSESAINYVSPLRAHPKRYYMLDTAKMTLTLDTLDGDAITEVLRDNTDLKERVNEWLDEFGLQIDISVFKEVIHKLKVNQDKLDLDITDVGFGISQILPVIIQGFFSKDNSLTIIEQPEIHLHPKMQAELADLFIDILDEGEGKQLLIETHSEYLLKRLRRRIAEGKISHNDVAIYLIAPNKTIGSSINNLDVESTGNFEYPSEYYSGELLRDATTFAQLFMKRQN